jgi:hypothetical protein
MRVTKLALGLGAAMIAGQVFAGVAEAQNRKAPRINLTTALGSSVATNYIEPAVTLSEDAYVFVISIDVDRRVQVLHPTETGMSVKMAARRQLHLPRFFAGYGAGYRYPRVTDVGYEYDYGSGYTDSRGTMIALASRRPFRLSNISVGGDWDVITLQRLVDDRDPYTAATLLAKALGAPGEPIGRDVHRFAGGAHYYNSAYNTAYADCSYLYGQFGFARGFNTGRNITFFRAAQLQQAGFPVAFLGFDACGQPMFNVYPHSTIVGAPAGRPPAAGAFPSGRLPSAAPRNPLKDSVARGMTGARPTPGRYADQNDAFTPPARRIPEAGSVSERPHPRAEGTTVSERPRTPAASPAPERAAPRHSPPPPERVATPRPVPERTAAPAYTPPPERASPPPPPPRAEPRVERERPAPAREPKSDGR